MIHDSKLSLIFDSLMSIRYFANLGVSYECQSKLLLMYMYTTIDLDSWVNFFFVSQQVAQQQTDAVLHLGDVHS